jgi:HPt (histidine-containing phosphotransfer) domain-containing protein
MTAPRLDGGTLDTLRELDASDNGFLNGILGDYMKHLQSSLLAIRQAESAGDWAKVRSVAHGLKGASGSVGAFLMRDLALQIEKHAAEPGILKPLLDQAQADADELIACIHKELSS